MITKNGIRLPVEVQNGTPVLPNEMCLELIEELEKKKRAKIRSVTVEPEEDEFELMTIWPQLTKVLNWLLRNKFEKKTV